MLKKQKSARPRATRSDRYAIIASRYNDKYVRGMLDAARAELKRAGARPEHVRVVRVPGAFEIPAVAATIAAERAADAILCLGVVLQGETSHAQHIGAAVSQALATIQIREGLPVIHEVLLFENESQARVRCLQREHNRGAEAARTAMAMVKVMKSLNR